MQNGGFYDAYKPQTYTFRLFPSSMKSFANACTCVLCVCVYLYVHAYMKRAEVNIYICF